MTFPFDKSPSTVWTLSRDGKTASCEVRFVPKAVEVRVLRNGNLLWSRVFQSGDAALHEAHEEYVRMIADGWKSDAETDGGPS